MLSGLAFVSTEPFYSNTKRVAKAVLISAVPPLMLKTAANPGGLPIEVFDEIRRGSLADRSQLYKDHPSWSSTRC